LFRECEEDNRYMDVPPVIAPDRKWWPTAQATLVPAFVKYPSHWYQYRDMKGPEFVWIKGSSFLMVTGRPVPDSPSKPYWLMGRQVDIDCFDRLFCRVCSVGYPLQEEISFIIPFPLVTLFSPSIVGKKGKKTANADYFFLISDQRTIGIILLKGVQVISAPIVILISSIVT